MADSCTACGTTPPPGARFCPSCGAEIGGGTRCVCGQPLGDRARFCAACGRATAAPAAPRAERRPVTVLFADAVGSTAFAERAGDEAAYRFVQDAVALMTAIVERHAGTITQFRGDGIMALFGAPVAHEDSAVRAATAALELRDELTTLGAANRCSFRIGLSTGPVVVGRVGDDVLMDYTAIGDTANVAARMEAAAPPGAVYLSDATWRAVRQFVEAKPVGVLDVKGKSAPIPAHEALRRRPIRTRLEAAVERGLGRFVARSAELDLLLGHVDGLTTGSGHVVHITGEAGIGKSRLLLELRRRLPQGVAWVEGRCSLGSSDAPYLPIADLLRNAFGIAEHDDPPTVAGRVDDASRSWGPDARATVPYLKYVLDVDPGDDTVGSMDARTRRGAIIHAIRVALADAGRRTPHVVVVEDVHWADSSSLDVLAALADTTAETAVLLVTTTRPGYGSPFDDRSNQTRVALDSLSRRAAMELTAAVLEVRDVPGDVADLITRKTEGNPLFVEELAASLLETGLLVCEDGRCRLTSRVDDVDVPGTLHDVILARIDRLAGEARDALQLAAVIGREFTVRLLDRLAELPEHLDQALEELKSVELIRQKAWYPELAYLFKHALTHEVTYATLLEERRRALHRLVADAIEEVYSDRIAEHVESLAHHWLVAEEWDRALDYLEISADRAAARFSNDAATSFYEQAIELAARLGQHRRGALLAQRLGDLRQVCGDFDGASATFSHMEELGRNAGDGELVAWALALGGEADAYSHDWQRADRKLRAALDVPGASDDVRLFASLFVLCYRVIFGFHDEALSDGTEHTIERLRRARPESARTSAAVALMGNLVCRWWGDTASALEFSETELPPEIDINSRQALDWEHGLALGDAGRYEEALAALVRTIERAEVAGEVMFRSRAINSIGWVRAEMGDHEGAVAWNQACVDFLEEIDIPDEEVESNARLNIADSLIALGHLDRAATEIARVEDIVRGKPRRGTWMLWRYSQHLLLSATSLHLARGELGAVGSRIDDCAALAEETFNWKYVVKAQRAAAARALADGRLDEAADIGRRALAAVSTLALPAERWRSHGIVATIAEARGDLELAHEHRRLADDVLASVAAGVRDPAGATGLARIRAGLR